MINQNNWHISANSNHLIATLDRNTLCVLGNVECAWYHKNSECEIYGVGYIGDDTGSQPQEPGVFLLNAYRKDNELFPSLVSGEWAAVIIDKHRGEIVVTHDVIGCRPIFFHLSCDKVVVGTKATEVAIGANKNCGFSQQVNRQYLIQLISNGLVSDNSTWWCGVSSIGHSEGIKIDNKRQKIFSTWKFGGGFFHMTDEECYEQFRSLLKQGIRLAANGQVGAELSGGLDSSTIYCLVNSLSDNNIPGISFTYSKSHTADERQWIEKVISRYPNDWINIDEDNYLPFCSMPSRSLDGPSRLHCMWGSFSEYERKITQASLNVILSGYGGDQVLYGDIVQPLYIADLLRYFRLSKAIVETERYRKEGLSSRTWLQAFWMYALKPNIRRFRRRSVREIRGDDQAVSWLTPSALSMVKHDKSIRVPPMIRRGGVGQQYCREALWRIGQSSPHFWDQELIGIEMRRPLLYRPLVEFMLSLPWDMRINPNCNRTVQRNSLTGILPNEILQRPDKRGPDEAFVRGLRSAESIVPKLFKTSLLQELEIIDIKSWEIVSDRARYGVINNMASFLATVSSEMWLSSILK